jgi:thioredoxin reductase
MKEIRVDVLVIGAGAAGMAASIESASRGCHTVLLEREDCSGGVLNQCIHNGFGLHVFKEELTGPEYADRFRRQMDEKGVQVRTVQFVVSIDPSKKAVITMSQEGAVVFHPKRVIMTTGARERAFGSLMIPGTRPSGIFTAGVAQRFVNLQNRLPGKKIFLLGSGDIGLIMARRLALEGADVLGVAELMPFPGGLARNIAQCLNDFDIPLHLSTSVVEVHGKDRLEAITIARFDPKTRTAIDGSHKKIEVDTLILSVGLIPQNELIDSFVQIHPTTKGVVVDSMMRTSHPWIFAAGNNVAIYDLVDFVTLDGKTAGQNASRFEETFPSDTLPIVLGKSVGVSIPNKIVKQGDPFILYLRSKKVIEKGIVEIGPGLIRRTRIGIKPSEMIDIPFTQKDLERLRESNLDRVYIDIQEGS